KSDYPNRRCRYFKRLDFAKSDSGPSASESEQHPYSEGNRYKEKPEGRPALWNTRARKTRLCYQPVLARQRLHRCPKFSARNRSKRSLHGQDFPYAIAKRSQKPEVRSQKSEVRSQRSALRSRTAVRDDDMACLWSRTPLAMAIATLEKRIENTCRLRARNTPAQLSR